MSSLTPQHILFSNLVHRKANMTLARATGLKGEFFDNPIEADLWQAFEKVYDEKRTWTKGAIATKLLLEDSRHLLSSLGNLERSVTTREIEESCKQIISQHNLIKFRLLYRETFDNVEHYKVGEDFEPIKNAIFELSKRSTDLDKAAHYEEPTGLAQAQEFAEDLEAKFKLKSDGKKFAIPTGLIELDEAFNGGWRKNNLILVGGRTGGGKTQFAVNAAYTAWMEGFKVAFFSCEMTGNQINGRICSRFTNIDNRRINNVDLTNDDFDRINAYTRQMQNDKLLIYQDFNSEMSNILAIIDREYRLKRCPDLVIIDYAQYLKPVTRHRETIDNMRSIANSCKDLAIKYPVAVLLLCQINREADEKGPEMRNIAASDGFGQNCDGAVLLHGTDAMREDNAIELRLRKMRYGVEGNHVVGADFAVSKFYSLTKEAKKTIITAKKKSDRPRYNPKSHHDL